MENNEKEVLTEKIDFIPQEPEELKGVKNLEISPKKDFEITSRSAINALSEMDSLETMLAFCTRYVKAGFAPVGMTAEQLIPILQTGWELGLKPLAAAQHIINIRGKIGLSIHLMKSLAHKKNIAFVITKDEPAVKMVQGKQTYDYIVEITTYRAWNPGFGLPPQVISNKFVYSLFNAIMAGLYDDSKVTAWTKWTKTMIRHRALTDAIRFECPEVLIAMGAEVYETTELLEIEKDNVKLNYDFDENGNITFRQ